MQFERIVNEITDELSTVYLRVPRTGPEARFLPSRIRKSSNAAAARSKPWCTRGGSSREARPSRSVSSVVLGALAAASLGRAQTPDDRPTPLPAFGRSIVSDEDSSAIVLNPANVALIPSWELRWQAAFLHESAVVPWQGHAFALTVPINLLNLGVGLRVDLIDPPAGTSTVSFGNHSNYTWLTGALAWSPSNALAFGASFQHMYSENPQLAGMSSWTLGYTLRPSINSASASSVTI